MPNVENYLHFEASHSLQALEGIKLGTDRLKRRLRNQGGFTITASKFITAGTIADNGEESYELEVRDETSIIALDLFPPEYAGYAFGTVTTSGGVPNSQSYQEGWGIKIEINDTNVIPGGITLKSGGTSYDWAPISATSLWTDYFAGFCIHPDDDVIVTIKNLTGGQIAGAILGVFGYDLNARTVL